MVDPLLLSRFSFTRFLLGTVLSLLMLVENAMAAELSGMKVDPLLSERAVVMMNRLVSANRVDPSRAVPGGTFKVQVVQSEDYNAATDGQTVYFTNTLWNAFTRDDQRAFVLSHELSHLLLGHVTQTNLRRMGLGALSRFVLSRFVKEDPRLQKVETVGLALLDLKFSRAMEYRADEFGLALMTQAGYDPSGAVQAFEILSRYTDGGGPEFLRSHPLSGSRIRALAKKNAP